MIVEERAERIQLRREREHVAVGHGARRGDAPQPAGLDRGGGRDPADVRAASREQAGVGAVRPAKPKSTTGRPAAASTIRAALVATMVE